MKYADKEKSLTVLIPLFFYLLLVIRNAWVSDDAMITFRVVENFLAGYGLGYNPFIRVQAFTHPLWLLLISLLYFVARLFAPYAPNALFYITVFLSVLFSALAVYLLLSRISNDGILSPVLAALLLGLSSGFVDFSTSGLENPLTHFLLVVFVLAYLREARSLFLLSFIASLLMLNRVDAFILTAPALAYVWWQSGNRRGGLAKLALGFAPMIVWELFSLVYFGFPFPNTAYAKLNTGIPSIQLTQQGIDYLLNSINWDPLILFSVALAGVVVYLERNAGFAALYAGVLLYLIYVIKIGGDFMSGRFLTAPLLLSVVIISSLAKFRRGMLAALGMVILLGVFSLRSPLWASNMVLYLPDYPIGDRNGISDQRLYYFGNPREAQFNSLAENGFREAWLGSQFAGEKWYFMGFRKVILTDALGKPGYERGPNFYMVDNFALSDPLLARLPVTKKYWQIGHFRRDLPEGYYETLETGENKIADPGLSMYYSRLQILTAGSLSSRERLLEIWKFNTGQYDHLLEEYTANVLH